MKYILELDEDQFALIRRLWMHYYEQRSISAHLESKNTMRGKHARRLKREADLINPVIMNAKPTNE